MQASAHKAKPHYAWFILASCIAFYSATMGVLVNTQGIFMPPMLKEFGWSATQYSTASIITGLVSVVTLTFVDKIYKKFPVKCVLLFSVLVYALSFLLKSATQSYLFYCILCFFIGIGGAFVLYVPVPMLLTAWFVEKRGFALGIALLSSGVAGAVMNPIVSSMIESMGWRTAIIIVAGIAMAISLPFIIFVVRKTPKEMGLLPYGVISETAGYNDETVDSEHGKKAQEHFNQRFTKEEKRNKFIICITLAAVLNILSFISVHIANYAATLGLAASIGATLTSVCMIGNMTSKAALGALMDHFGKLKTLGVSMAIVTIAYVVLGISNSVFIMYVCAFFLGITAAHNTMVAPVMVESFAIGDEYTAFLSRVTMGTMFANAFGSVIMSSLMEAAGSYKPVFLAFAVVSAMSLMLLVGFFKKKK